MGEVRLADSSASSPTPEGMGGSSAAASQHASAQADGFIDARARTEFLRICLATLCFSITQNYSALLAVVFAQAGRSLPEIGVLISLFALPTVMATFTSGAICSRLGVLPSVRAALTLTLVGLGSLAFTKDWFAAALASRLIQGCGVGLLLPSALVYVQSRLTHTRFIYLVTAFSAMIPLAAAIAPPLGEWTLGRFGPTVLFLSSTIWCFAGLILTLGLRRAQPPAREHGLGVGRVLKARYAAPILAVLIGGIIYGYVISFMSEDLTERGVHLAWFFVPATAAMLASRFLAMRRLHTVHPRRLVSAGLFASAIGLAASAVVSAPAAIAAAGVGFGAGNSLMFPVVAAWIGRGTAADERAGGQAVASTSFYFGIYAAPFFQAYLIEAIGFRGTEAAFAGLSVCAALALLIPGVSSID